MKRLSIAVGVFIGMYGAAVLAQSFLIFPNPQNKWIEVLYRANGAAPGAKPSTLMLGGTAVGFVFPLTPDSSMFTTRHPAYNTRLLGNLTNNTVSADVTITAEGSGAFTYYGQTPTNPCGTPASVRLYFETQDNTLGESQYWWSNPSSEVLAAGTRTITAALIPSAWSDRDGHSGTYDGAHSAAFTAAVADVQQIGLSFGGGCFFANGVGHTTGATLALTNFTVQ